MVLIHELKWGMFSHVHNSSSAIEHLPQ